MGTEVQRMQAAGIGRLFRSLSLADLSVLASSSMAPAYSLAAVMGLVVAAPGTGAPLALIVSTIPIAFIAIGFMRLATEKPSAGGDAAPSSLAERIRLGHDRHRRPCPRRSALYLGLRGLGDFNVQFGRIKGIGHDSGRWLADRIAWNDGAGLVLHGRLHARGKR